MKYRIVSLMAISGLICGCADTNPYQTSNRESFQYTESAPVPAQEDAVVYVPVEPPASYSNDYYEPAVPMGTVEPPPNTYYPTERDAYNESGYYGYQGAQQPLETAQKAVSANTEMAEEKLRQAKEAESKQEYGTMMALLDEASTEGSAEAYYQLAKHYMKGDVVPANEDLATIQLQQAQALGHPEAARVLAWNELKKPTAGDLSLGRSMMEQAANNSVRAKRELGLLLINVYQPNLNDPALGKFYLDAAYQEGDAEAAYQLYVLSKKSGSDSIEHLDFAANAGYPAALVARSKIKLARGDKQAAQEDMEKGALAGDSNAMYTYANNLQLGAYGNADREEKAYVWFAICAEKGNSAASNELNALAGVKKIADKKEAGSMDSLIAETKSKIQPWNNNSL